jgi:hypothetical protein
MSWKFIPPNNWYKSGSGSAVDPAIAILNDGNTVGWYDYMVGVTKDGSDHVTAWANKLLVTASDLKNYGGTPHITPDGVLFDGDYLKTDPFTLIQPIIIYMVVKQITWSDVHYFTCGNIGDTLDIIQWTTTPNIIAEAGALSSPSDKLALNTWGIIRVQFNGVSSKLIVDSNTPITGNFGNGNPGGFTLAANSAGTACSNISVKEVILRNIIESTPNELLIYSYLKNKHLL